MTAEIFVIGKKQSFDDFWKLYPRKQGKGTARKAWGKALKLATPEEIISGLESQLGYLQSQYRGPSEDFRPHPSTWLNGERWADEHEAQMDEHEMAVRALEEKWRRQDAEQPGADNGTGDRQIAFLRPSITGK